MKKALIYMRVASHENADFILFRQSDEIVRFCENNGYAVAGAYTDTGSGLDNGLPGRNLIIDRITKEHIDAVIVTSFDRVSRIQADLIVFYGFLKEHSADLISVREGSYQEHYNQITAPFIKMIEEMYPDNLPDMEDEEEI